MSKTSIRINGVKTAPLDWNFVNVQFEKLTSDLRLLSLPGIDSDIIDNCEYDLKQIVRAVISSRFIKYWERPNTSSTRARRQSSFDAWSDNESRLRELKCRFNYRSAVKHNRLSREIGRKVLRKLRENYYPIDFGPGESFKTQKGSTHLVSKLDPLTHTVTHKNLNLWVTIITATRGLFKPYVQLYAKLLHSQFQLEPICKDRDWKRNLVLAVISTIDDYIVYGSRQAQVPKDNEENRVIEVNPIGDVVCQKVVGWAFRSVLLEYNIDLDKNQSLHMHMLRYFDISTLDAKKASDSITPNHVQWFFDRELSEILISLSQEYILVDGVYVRQEKLCSMGSGFTFELLTTIFLTISRTYDNNALVYGDDIIVKSVHAYDVASALNSLGFIINKKKSFINSLLRESCGGFFLIGYGYITTFKFTYAENAVEAIAAINKLGRVIQDYQKKIGTDEFSELLSGYHACMVTAVPPEYLGPLMPNSRPWSKKQGSRDVNDYENSIVSWVECPTWRKRKIRSKTHDRIVTLNRLTIEGIAWNYQYSINELYSVLVPVLKNELDIGAKNKVKFAPLLYSYIKEGRRSEYVKKGRNQRVLIQSRLIDVAGGLIV